MADGRRPPMGRRGLAALPPWPRAPGLVVHDLVVRPKPLQRRQLEPELRHRSLVQPYILYGPLKVTGVSFSLNCAEVSAEVFSTAPQLKVLGAEAPALKVTGSSPSPLVQPYRNIEPAFRVRCGAAKGGRRTFAARSRCSSSAESSVPG